MADTQKNPCFKVGPKGVPGLGPKEMTRLYPAIDFFRESNALLTHSDVSIYFRNVLLLKIVPLKDQVQNLLSHIAKSNLVHNACIIQKFVFLYSFSLENQHPHLQKSQYKSFMGRKIKK